MKLKELIKKHGWNPSEQKVLKVSKDKIESLEGLKKFTGLTDLTLAGYSIEDLQRLKKAPFRKSLSRLTLDNIGDTGDHLLDNIGSTRDYLDFRYALDPSLFSRYASLERLDLSHVTLSDLSQLSGTPIANSLEILRFDHVTHDDLSFLEALTQLKEFRVYQSSRLKDLSGLQSATPAQNLETLFLMGVMIEDASFLSSYQRLKRLFLDISSLEDVSPLISPVVARTLEELYLGQPMVIDGLSTPAITDYSFLSEFKNLRTLRMDPGRDEEVNLSSFLSEPLTRTIEDLWIGSLRDISLLSRFENISTLHLQYTPFVSDIYPLLDFPFVKNGSLKEIEISHAINFHPLFGGQRNTNTVRELVKKGVEVRLPANFYYSEDPRPWGKVIVLVGPSGGGKSTLIEYMKDNLNVQQLAKCSTRSLRPGEDPGLVRSVEEALFDERFKSGALLAAREQFGNKYGVDVQDLARAYASDDAYFLDMCDPLAAFSLRDQFPGFVKVVMLLTPPELVEKGLEARGERFLRSGAEDQYRATLDRALSLEGEYRKLRAFSWNADYVIESSYKEAEQRMKELVKE